MKGRASGSHDNDIAIDVQNAFGMLTFLYSALCAVRKVYFSAQPNKLKPILNFQKYYPI